MTQHGACSAFPGPLLDLRLGRGRGRRGEGNGGEENTKGWELWVQCLLQSLCMFCTEKLFSIQVLSSNGILSLRMNNWCNNRV